MNTIFRKRLYMLLPFYIFVYEKKLKEYESSESKCQGLQDGQKEGQLSTYVEFKRWTYNFVRSRKADEYV